MNSKKTLLLLTALLISASGFAEEKQEKKYLNPMPGAKGEWVLTFKSSSKGDICGPMTRNLNEFRKLDFEACHPRLSEKYPEFSRPEWTEVPFDLDMAKKAYQRTRYSKELLNKKMRPMLPNIIEMLDREWQQWLTDTDELRKVGKVKMWRIEADVDHDGTKELIYRLGYATPLDKTKPMSERACEHKNGGMWVERAGSIDAQIRIIAAAAQASDLIHWDGQDYLIDWQEYGEWPMGNLTWAMGPGIRVISVATSVGDIGNVCLIRWVPTKSASNNQKNK